jgi:hypothetical protein
VPASDASHFYENIETTGRSPSCTAYPAWTAGRRLRPDQGAGRRPELVVAGHDPRVLERFSLLEPDIAVISE